MKFGRSDDLGELLHVRRLDVDNVEALILDVQVPEIYAQIVATDECLPVAVDGYAIDVIRVSVGVGSSRDRGHNSIVMGETGELQR